MFELIFILWTIPDGEVQHKFEDFQFSNAPACFASARTAFNQLKNEDEFNYPLYKLEKIWCRSIPDPTEVDTR